MNNKKKKQEEEDKKKKEDSDEVLEEIGTDGQMVERIHDDVFLIVEKIARKISEQSIIIILII